MIQNMPASIFATHGGALDLAQRVFPKAPRPWLDLSTGINPRPYPLPQIPDEAWTSLPSAEDLALLEATAARRYGAAAAMVVAAPGTQAIIQRLPSICSGDDIRILGPTYGEFERVFRAHAATVGVVPHIEALAGTDVAVVVNPNNPDGRLVSAADLAMLASRVGTLVVDEAFMEAAAPTSLVGRVSGERTIVLRSFGKFYGLAGIRLGFAITAPERAIRLREKLGPWAVPGPTITIGRAALADDVWPQATRVRLASDVARLTFLLRQVGAEAVGGTSLFLLASHPQASRLFDTLANDGILTRPFVGATNLLRFGLPGTDGDWARLDASLKRFAG